VAHGFTVLVGSRDFERGEAAAKEVGPDGRALQLDVTNRASITAAAERVRNEFGRLDVLVQNAAISNTRKLPDQSIEEYAKTTRPSNVSLDEMRAVWDTNVFGVLAVYQAMLPLLRETPGARIVNVSSGAGSLTTNSDPACSYLPVTAGFGVAMPPVSLWATAGLSLSIGTASSGKLPSVRQISATLPSRSARRGAIAACFLSRLRGRPGRGVPGWPHRTAPVRGRAQT
jgi:NAD(P)-dependent dehydrogenase (short-subunit alcohol dehydrogenase family)